MVHDDYLSNSASTEQTNQRLAPVALFVYNRTEPTRQTLRALMNNHLAAQTDLYVFSDGGRDEDSWAEVRKVRALLREIQLEIIGTKALHSMTIVERPHNYYLERNIIEGIAQVFEAHDTIIVLEDDIVTAPYFLQFMNDGFSVYRDDTQVMHIGGFTRIETDANFYFSPFMAGWGWGTWRNRWQQHFRHYTSRSEALDGLSQQDLDVLEYGGVFPCLKHLDRTPIPWDICWGIAVHRAHGLCLYPSRTLVRNIGLEAGTHFRSLPLWRLIQRFEYDRIPYQASIPVAHVMPAESSNIEAQLREALTDWGIRYTWLGKLIRWCYKRFH